MLCAGRYVPIRSFLKFDSDLKFASRHRRRLWSVFADAYTAEAREDPSFKFKRFSLPQFIDFLARPVHGLGNSLASHAQDDQ